MIVKKAKFDLKKAANRSIAGNIESLVNYIRHNSAGKVLLIGGKNFLTTASESQKLEMMALAGEARRAKAPTTHYIFSWRENEKPSPQQFDEVVTIFLQEAGLPTHQAIYAVHQNTNNIHLHLVVNRVNPDNFKCVEINKGFDIELAHKVVALIEKKQGWKSEVHGRYQVADGAPVKREVTAPAPIDQRRIDVEHRTGEKSVTRLGLEKLPKLVTQILGWDDFHTKMGEQGFRYERKGSGAVIKFGEEVVKASSVHRSFSLASLEKQLGPFKAADPKIPVAQAPATRPRVMDPDMPLLDVFTAARAQHYAERNSQREGLRQEQDAAWRLLFAKYKARRDEIFSRSFVGQGRELNAIRSLLALDQAKEKVTLKEKCIDERKELQERFKPFPDFKTWLHLRGETELANLWRYRNSSEHQSLSGPAQAPNTWPQPNDIRHFKATAYATHVAYSSISGGAVAFTDTGQRINVFAWKNEAAVRAALQLAAAKWGTVTITGNKAYCDMCIRLAVQNEIKLGNPELQEQIAAEKNRQIQERQKGMEAIEAKLFTQYAQAVRADRYRVTAKNFEKNKAFILDEIDGESKGFTPDELLQQIAEMKRLASRNENIYYTPLSDQKHYLLIDDMTKAKLQKLIDNGYKPTAVLESSPGNFQALITIPKLGSPNDKEVGNRLGETLNREYGDPKLSGAIDAHRAPGFPNLKPKYQVADGTFPFVGLAAARGGDCYKALEQAKAIEQQISRQKIKESSILKENESLPVDLQRSPTALDKAAMTAFRKHREEAIRLLTTHKNNLKLDPSRLDYMTALRLRITGHSFEAVQMALFKCAEEIEGRRKSDLENYVERTAGKVFGEYAAEDILKYSKYETQWRALEGQKQQPEDGPIFSPNPPKGMSL